jgi:choline-glycine betaine transporter
MGTLTQRGTIHPSRGVVVFWGAVMGAIAAIMLMVGGNDALSGIQNITIIMAAPFTIVMVLMCVALTKDLRKDPLMLRGHRCTEAIEKAVEFGEQNYGNEFFVPVKPHRERTSASESSNDSPHENDASVRPRLDMSDKPT